MGKRVDYCTKCGKLRTIEAKGLCKGCYTKQWERNHIKPEIKCSECGSVTIKYTGTLCDSCYNKQRWADGKGRGREIICKRCGRTRPNSGKGLCASCKATMYREENNYKGPRGVCSSCGLETYIKAKGMCNKCYCKAYDATHKEVHAKRDALRRKLNPEKFRIWNNNWYAKNREKISLRRKELYAEDIEGSREKRRRYSRLNSATKTGSIVNTTVSSCKSKTGVPIEKRIEAEIALMPDLKRVWVIEFISSVFEDRAKITKLTFIRGINRIIFHIRKKDAGREKAGWNMVTLADIDGCQVETGILKDSLRVFFRWLHNRKAVTLDLSAAIPTSKIKRRKPKSSKELLAKLFNQWNQGVGSPQVCIAGLLIIYFGMTNEELRFLKVDNFAEGKVFLNGEWLELDPILWDKIISYLEWRESFYFGLAPDYFFVTGISVTNKKPVDISYFVKRFKLENIPVTPSDIRKAMIYFHKEHGKVDPPVIGQLFRIKPRSASVYFK